MMIAREIKPEEFEHILENLFASFVKPFNRKTAKAWFWTVRGLTFNDVTQAVEVLMRGDEFPKSPRAFKYVIDQYKGQKLKNRKKEITHDCKHCQNGNVFYLIGDISYAGRCSICKTSKLSAPFVNPLRVKLAFEHSNDNECLKDIEVDPIVEKTINAKTNPKSKNEIKRFVSLKIEEERENQNYSYA